MERFSATVSIEELKAKARNTHTTKSTCQWLRVYLSWAKLRNKGLRGRQEHHNMKIEDFTFKKHDGFTYLTFSEGITKTMQSGLREKYRVQITKMFETRNDRFPVKIFRTYLAKRPADCKHQVLFT